jgi:hypothetical protein
MSHPLVLALFDTAENAARAARALNGVGIGAERLSVVARNHEVEGDLATRIGATPGAEIEDSRVASRLGELSAQVLAVIALVLPGVGPIVAAGPLSAGLGEAAGHVAGHLSGILERAGVAGERAHAFERAIEAGAVLLGAHAVAGANVASICEALERNGGREVTVAEWRDGRSWR